MTIKNLRHILAMSLWQLTNNEPEDDGLVPVPTLGVFLGIEGLHLDPMGIERELLSKLLEVTKRMEQ